MTSSRSRRRPCMRCWVPELPTTSDTQGENNEMITAVQAVVIGSSFNFWASTYCVTSV
jgi:hypothetical protein